MAKTKKKVITIEDENAVSTLEAFNYEMSSRRDLLASMVQMGVSPSDDNFQAYHKEYEEAYVKYEAAKADFERNFVRPHVGDQKLNWNLDFQSRELTIFGIE